MVTISKRQSFFGPGFFIRFVVFFLCLIWVGPACIAQEDPDFQQKESQFFIIYHKKNSNPGVLQSIVRRGEKYIEDFREKLGLDPFEHFAELTAQEKIKVYLYPDQDSYHSVGPAMALGHADPADRSIYGYSNIDFSILVLSHELGHILFYDAIGPKSFSLSPEWLLEGVSCYLERGGGKWLREPYIKEALLKKTFIPFKELSSYLFFHQKPDEINLFYSEAASIVNFLIETYGLDSFRAFCGYLKQDKSLEDAIGLSFSGLNGLKGLGEAWESYLKNRMGH